MVLGGLRVSIPLKQRILGEKHEEHLRNVPDEGSRQELCLVAWHRPRYRNNSQVMPGLHQSGQYTSHSATAPVVMAKTTLAACAHRLTSQNIKGSIFLS